MPIYNAPLITIDRNETGRYAGMKPAAFCPDLLEEACNEAQILAKPQGAWELYPYDAKTHIVDFFPPFHIKGEKIQHHLQDARQVAVLAVTIGAAIETSVHTYFKAGRYAYSLLLDAAGTAAVEAAADALNDVIDREARLRGYRTTWRFSPGYGDWDVRVQKKILRLAQAERIQLSATESYMLIPRKSITALIGFIPHPLSAPARVSHCAVCEQQNCLARKETEE